MTEQDGHSFSHVESGDHLSGAAWIGTRNACDPHLRGHHANKIEDNLEDLENCLDDRSYVPGEDSDDKSDDGDGEPDDNDDSAGDIDSDDSNDDGDDDGNVTENAPRHFQRLLAWLL